MPRHGDDVGRGVGSLCGEQVELLALVVNEADVHLDAGFGLELLAKAVGDKIGIGPDVHFASLRMGPAEVGRACERGGTQNRGAEEASSAQA